MGLGEDTTSVLLAINIIANSGVARNLLMGDKQEVWRAELPSGV